jgi:hypothetical protein
MLMTMPTSKPEENTTQSGNANAFSKKRESARKIYIRIMEQVGDDDEAHIMYELVESGYAVGAKFQNSDGSPRGARITHLTTRGRLFLQELREQEKKDQLSYKFRTAFVFFVGIAATQIPDIIKSFIK